MTLQKYRGLRVMANSLADNDDELTSVLVKETALLSTCNRKVLNVDLDMDIDLDIDLDEGIGVVLVLVLLLVVVVVEVVVVVVVFA